MQPQWKTQAQDLRDLAQAVRMDPPVQQLSARDAAVSMFGFVRAMAHQFGQDVMQRACAELVRDRATWATSFSMLPTPSDQGTGLVMYLVSAMARGVLAVAGEQNTKAALSFWACEDDPAVWEWVLNADIRSSSKVVA